MELQAALVAVGFTEYEARVYIALLDAYPDTGYQISKRSGVPRSMVYEALGRLKHRGAVLETRESRGLLYRPLPPDVLLDHHEAEQRRLLDGLRRGLSALYEASDDERVWALSGAPAVRAYAARLIRRAESELLLVLNDHDLAALLGDIQEACARGVRVGSLLTGSGSLLTGSGALESGAFESGALDCGEVAYHPPLESELQELSGTLIVARDGAEALIANAALDTTATVTTNRNLVMITRQFVWMELFTQRVYARLGPDLLAQLDPQDRQIFESHHDSGR